MLFAVYFFFITLLPILNIVSIKTLEAERFLYLPSIGFCLLISYMASMLGEKFDKPVMGKAGGIAIMLSCLLIIGYSSKTIVRARDWKDESTISRKTLEANSNRAWAILASGINFIDRENYIAAAELLKSGVASCSCSTHQKIRVVLGECYLKMGRYEEAIGQLNEVIKAGTFSVMARNFMGVAYANLKKYDEAEKHFTAALKEDPGYLKARLNLGRLYEMKGDHGKAIKEYEKALETTNGLQDRALLFIRIGDAYLKMGSRPEARSHYRKALEIAGKESDLMKKLVEDKLKRL